MIETKNGLTETEEAEETRENAPEEAKGKKKPGRRKNETKDITDPNEAVKTLSEGRLKLFRPFLADNVEIEELKYNFENMDGVTMMAAMDRGAKNGGNAFRITNEQALELFIASAAKETDGVDATDIRRGLGSVDAVKAVQLATVFFVASSQAGNARIMK